MPPAAHSRLCSRDSAWAVVFAGSIICFRNSLCNVSSASYIFQCKAIFFHQINSWFSWDRLWTAMVSPCRTPATVSKKSLSPPGERTFTSVNSFSKVFPGNIVDSLFERNEKKRIGRYDNVRKYKKVSQWNVFKFCLWLILSIKLKPLQHTVLLRGWCIHTLCS